jgi:hypothetical protein
MPTKYISIKNLDKYQKTKSKEGTRPWVKLWKTIRNDPEFINLSPTYRYIYIMLILLADDTQNKIYADHTYLRQMLYMTHTDGIHGTYIGHTQLDLKPLYRSKFLNTSNLARVLSEKSREEERREETEENAAEPLKVLVDFDTFWKEYPRKEKKQDALKAWNRLNPDHTLLTLIITRLSEHKASDQWKKENGKYIPHASTWINGKRWEDELTAKPSFSLPKPRPALIIEQPAFKPTIGKDEAESILKRLVPSIGKL